MSPSIMVLVYRYKSSAHLICQTTWCHFPKSVFWIYCIICKDWCQMWSIHYEQANGLWRIEKNFQFTVTSEHWSLLSTANKPYLPSCHSEHPPHPEFPAASNFPVWQTVCQIQNLACVLTCNVSGGPTEAHLRELYLYIKSITNYKNWLIFYKRCVYPDPEAMSSRTAQWQTLYLLLDLTSGSAFNTFCYSRTNKCIHKTDRDRDRQCLCLPICVCVCVTLCMGASVWCMTIHTNTIFRELVAD